MGIRQFRRRKLILPFDPQGQNIPRIHRIVDDGLVAYWNFRDGYMTSTLFDRIGGNDGTIENAVAGVFWGNGKGHGVFDGVDEFVGVGAISVLNTVSFTLDLWSRPLTTSSGRRTMFSRGSGVQWQLERNSNSIVTRIDFDDATSSDLTVTNIAVAGRWNHYSVTWGDVSKNFTLYQDGVQVATSNNPGKTLDTGSNVVRIGQRGSSRYWDGSIASVKFYDRELSMAESDQNFQAERLRYEV